MTRKNFWRLAAAVLALLALISVFFFIRGIIKDNQAKEQAEALCQSAVVTPAPTPMPTPEPTPEPTPQSTPTPEPAPEPTSTPVEIPVDFQTLRETNEDIYAWLSIPDTGVEFPVVQSSEDNAYYLTHDIYGEENENGSIYTENYNSKDFTDFNTVIYGHNMRSGAMLAPLMNYRDKTFFDDNPYIYIYLPDRILKYEIFAAYVFDDRHLLSNADFSTVIARQLYINYIFSIRSMNCNVNSQVPVTADDSILTLSTCTYTNGERYLVQGVLIEIEQ